MSKSEVYSWRVSTALKSALEDVARSQNTSVAQLLERIVTEWLNRPSDSAEKEEKLQRRVHEEAGKYEGKLRGGDPHLAKEASERIKAVLEEKSARHRTD